MFIIKTLKFNDYEDLAMALADKYDEIKDNMDSMSDYTPAVTYIVKYDEAKKIISELVGMGYPLYSIAEFSHPDFGGYYDEYSVSIYDNELWIEPMKRKDGYILEESYICYIADNCNSKVLKHISTPMRYEVQIRSDYSDNKDDGKCTCYHCTKRNKWSWENGEKIENIEADILDSIAEAWDRIGRLNKLFEELNK